MRDPFVSRRDAKDAARGAAYFLMIVAPFWLLAMMRLFQ